MKAVVDRIVQYANRYQLTNVETGEVLGTFDFDEVTGTVQQVGTEIDAELFDSIAEDLAARVKLSGGELAETIVTFPDISGTAENVASGDTSATLWGKVKNWFSRLKALAFKNKVAAGDFEAGAIKNADVAADAAIAQSKVSGLMTDYVASISASGRTVTYKNKNGVNMGSITTQDTTYELASPSGNGLMSATDKTKLDGIESGAQKNTVLGVKGSSESAYRTGNVNITKENIGLGNVDNTSDEDKPISTAVQTALDNITTDVLKDVIRTDEAQDLTETKKKTFAANMGKPYGTKYSGGWMKMAVLKRTGSSASALYAVFLISSSNNPMAYGLLKVSAYATASALYERSIELISLSNYGLNPSLIRGVYDNSDSSITIYVKGSSAYNAITLQTISNYGLEPFDITIDPENVTTEPTANITCTWGRIEAGSFVQDGHNVALQDGTYSDMTAGEANNAENVTTNINGRAITSIFETDGTTVKKAQQANYLSAAIYRNYGEIGISNGGHFTAYYSIVSKGEIDDLTSLNISIGNAEYISVTGNGNYVPYTENGVNYKILPTQLKLTRNVLYVSGIEIQDVGAGMGRDQVAYGAKVFLDLSFDIVRVTARGKERLDGISY